VKYQGKTCSFSVENSILTIETSDAKWRADLRFLVGYIYNKYKDTIQLEFGVDSVNTLFFNVKAKDMPIMDELDRVLNQRK